MTNVTPRGSSIIVASGRYVDPLNLRPDDVDGDDIAAALSKLCRFTGHIRDFYSVGHHTLFMEKLVSLLTANDAAELRSHDRADLFSYTLLHDAGEAYLGDVARPLKHHNTMGAYRDAEERVLAAIHAHFNLPINPIPPIPDIIKLADDIAVSIEASVLFPTGAIYDWQTPHVAASVAVDAVGWFNKVRTFSMGQVEEDLSDYYTSIYTRNNARQT